MGVQYGWGQGPQNENMWQFRINNSRARVRCGRRLSPSQWKPGHRHRLQVCNNIRSPYSNVRSLSVEELCLLIVYRKNWLFYIVSQWIPSCGQLLLPRTPPPPSPPSLLFCALYGFHLTEAAAGAPTTTTTSTARATMVLVLTADTAGAASDDDNDGSVTCKWSENIPLAACQMHTRPPACRPTRSDPRSQHNLTWNFCQQIPIFPIITLFYYY